MPVLGLALLTVSSQKASLPYSQMELIVYFVGVMIIGILTEQWQSWFIAEDINSGDFSFNLLRPFSTYLKLIVEKLSDVSFKLGTISLLLIISINFIPKTFLNQLTFTPVSVMLFLISLVMGFLIVFTLEVNIGLAAVWFYDIDFIKKFIELFNYTFSGRFIPLVFFPPSFALIGSFLPFRYTVSFPLEILLNKLNPNQIVTGMSIELFWLIAVGLGYKYISSQFSKKYQGFGA